MARDPEGELASPTRDPEGELASPTRDWDLRADELAARAIADGESTAWFDRLYAEGAAGLVGMPWDRSAPQRELQEWAEQRGLDGRGRTAVVVGCGLGADAQYLSRLGFTVTAFDVAPTAIAEARARYPASSVTYVVADLLDLPGAWADGFDLVVEIYTVQALPEPPRSAAIQAIAGLVAPAGTLLAVAFRLTPGDDPDAGPPFPLTRDVLDSYRAHGLTEVEVAELDGPRWRAEYVRRDQGAHTGG